MNESFKCSDKIAMLHLGKIVEYGTVQDIKNSRNLVVKQFISGSSNGPIRLK
jgi:phospholipid/cholesterol/gamma-HCH transport system ATP-binding protein